MTTQEYRKWVEISSKSKYLLPVILREGRINLSVAKKKKMVKAMDCGIVVREFVLQSRYYVHFRTNILGKGMNPLIPLAMG